MESLLRQINNCTTKEELTSVFLALRELRNRLSPQDVISLTKVMLQKLHNLQTKEEHKYHRMKREILLIQKTEIDELEMIGVDFLDDVRK